MWYVTEVRDGPVGADRVRWPHQPPAPADLPDAFASYRRFYDKHAGAAQ
jgi:hypothetical protein